MVLAQSGDLVSSKRVCQKSKVTKSLIKANLLGNHNAQVSQQRELTTRKTSPSELFHQGSRSLQVIMPLLCP